LVIKRLVIKGATLGCRCSQRFLEWDRTWISKPA